MGAPIEAKVKTSALASTVTAVVLAAASRYLFGGGDVPDFLEVAITSAVGGLLTGAVAFVVGFATKHTPRVIEIQADNRDW